MRSLSRKYQPALKELKSLKGKLMLDVPMANYTTMRAGGCAPYLYQPQALDDLRQALRICQKDNIKVLVIGLGSNIIVGDNGIDRLVIRLSSRFFTKIETAECGEDEISCGAGASLAKLCSIAERNYLSGCEFLVGIPGTMGGAVVQNAGAFGSSISDIVKDVKCLEKNGNIKILKRDEIRFGYRKSDLKGIIVLGATFILKKGKRADIQKRVNGYIKKRLATQDYTAPSAGCIFKNPENSKLSAGALIDRCGLKGRAAGGAAVSEKHANFIINKDGAKAKDIFKLISLIKKSVKEKFGVYLEEEVEIIR